MTSAKPNGGSFHPIPEAGNSGVRWTSAHRPHRPGALGAATALATIMCLTWPGTASAQDVDTKGATPQAAVGPVTLPPSAAWTDMNLDVSAGDSLIIRARAAGQQVGPAGFPKMKGGVGAILPEAPAYALVGRIGAAGAPFLVGGGKIASLVSGTLQLARNVPREGNPARAAILTVGIEDFRPAAPTSSSRKSPTPAPVARPSPPPATRSLPPQKTGPHRRGRHPHPPPAPIPSPPQPGIPPLWMAIGLAGALGIAALAGLTLRKWAKLRRQRALARTASLVSLKTAMKPPSTASGFGKFAKEIPAAELRTRLETGAISWPGGTPEGVREADDA